MSLFKTMYIIVAGVLEIWLELCILHVNYYTIHFRQINNKLHNVKIQYYCIVYCVAISLKLYLFFN